jgi:hypothetical protein
LTCYRRSPVISLTKIEFFVKIIICGIINSKETLLEWSNFLKSTFSVYEFVDDRKHIPKRDKGTRE